MNIQEQEERDYQEGVEYTQWLIGRWEGLQAAPVYGEEGWTQELEDERQRVRAQLYPGDFDEGAEA